MLIARFVEETLEDNVLLARDQAQCRTGGGEIQRQLRRCGRLQTHFPGEPVPGRGLPLRQQFIHCASQPRYRAAQFIAAPRRFSQPEGHVGRLSLCVLDTQPALFHLAHPIGRVAQLKHVAGQAFERKVLIDRAHQVAVRFQDYVIIKLIRDRAGIGDCREPRPGPAANDAIHRITLNIAAAPPAARGEAIAEHVEHGIEFSARQIPIGPGAGAKLKQLRFGPVPARHVRNELLRQHIQMPRRDLQFIQFLASHRVQQRRALQQIIPCQRKQPALGGAAQLMAGATHPLQERGDSAG